MEKMTQNKNTIKALDRMFNARAIAVVGASNNPTKFGYATVKTIVDGGYDGKLYPINRRADQVQGLRAFPSVSDVPGELDLAIIIVPAPFCADVLRQSAAQGAKAALVLSAGFRESGYPELEDELASVAQACGIRVLGPNIQGMTYMPNKLCAMFWPVVRNTGSMAIISQSGSVTAALIEWADGEGLGIAAAVNLGNKMDISETDLLEYFGQDEHTRAIALYLEGVKDGRRFVDTVKRVAQSKPIAVLKSGRSATGQRSVASHTGALAGNDGVFTGLCRQFGLVRTDELESLFDAAKALSAMRRPRGKRLLVISTSGGGNTLAVDEAEKHGLVMPPLPPAFVEKLNTIGLPLNAGIANPLDLASLEVEHFLQAASMADECDVADTVLISFGDPVVGSTEAVKRAASTISASLAVTYFGGGELEKVSSVEIQAAGVPVFSTPERASRGIAAAVWDAEYRRSRGGDVCLK